MRIMLLCCLLIIARLGLVAADAPLDLDLEAAIAQGTEIAEAMGNKDGDILEQFIDYDALMERALRGLSLTAKERAEYGRGFRNAATFGKQIVAQTSKSGSYTLLRGYRRDGKIHLLFRMITNEEGINYHDLLVAGSGKKMRAVDLYVYLTGEDLSETVRRLSLPAIADSKKTTLGKMLTGTDGADTLEGIQSVRRSVAAGDFQGGYDAVAALPEKSRKQKIVQILRLQCSQHLGEVVYAKTIKDIAAMFPDDPALNLILVDGYFLSKEYDAACACVDRLYTAVGGDPHLHLLKAGMRFTQGDLEATRKDAAKAVAEDASMVNGWWILVNVSLKQKQFTETARLLIELENRFSLAFEDLGTLPDYAGFVASPEYHAWLKREKKKAAEPAKDDQPETKPEAKPAKQPEKKKPASTTIP